MEDNMNDNLLSYYAKFITGNLVNKEQYIFQPYILLLNILSCNHFIPRM